MYPYKYIWHIYAYWINNKIFMNLLFCQLMSVYAGINWHKLVFVTDWQKLGLCRHFANTGQNRKSYGSTPASRFTIANTNIVWLHSWRNRTQIGNTRRPTFLVRQQNIAGLSTKHKLPVKVRVSRKKIAFFFSHRLVPPTRNMGGRKSDLTKRICPTFWQVIWTFIPHQFPCRGEGRKTGRVANRTFPCCACQKQGFIIWVPWHFLSGQIFVRRFKKELGKINQANIF